MILTIDIGNTNTKIGVLDDDGRIDKFFMLTSDATRTSDDTTGLLMQMLTNARVNETDIAGAIISSVVPKLDSMFASVVYSIFGVRPVVLNPSLKTGLRIGYKHPSELGSDRIAACAAALKHYGAPFILVDFGTATTFNVVSEGGEFMGGAIALGLNSAACGLAKSTARLPNVTLSAPVNAVAHCTADAIRSGVVLGAVGQVKYLLERFRSELGLDEVKYIATGGLADLVQSVEPVFDHVDKDLALKGLYEIYRLNA